MKIYPVYVFASLELLNFGSFVFFPSIGREPWAEGWRCQLYFVQASHQMTYIPNKKLIAIFTS